MKYFVQKEGSSILVIVAKLLRLSVFDTSSDGAGIKHTWPCIAGLRSDPCLQYCGTKGEAQC